MFLDLIPNAGKLLEQKLGLTTEVVNTNNNSDFPSLFRPMNSHEKEIMQLSIEQIYGDFVGQGCSRKKNDPKSMLTASDREEYGADQVLVKLDLLMKWAD